MPITTPPTPGRRRRDRFVLWTYAEHAVVLTALATVFLTDVEALPPAALGILVGSLLIVALVRVIAWWADLADGAR